MKITIELTRKEMEHFKDCQDYYDACSTYQDILLKIKKEVEKSGNKR